MEHRGVATSFKLPSRYLRLLCPCWPSYFLVRFPVTSSTDEAQLSGAASGSISYYPHLVIYPSSRPILSTRHSLSPVGRNLKFTVILLSYVSSSQGVDCGIVKGFFSSSKHPDRFWGSQRLIFNQHWRSFPGIKQLGREVDHHLHVMLKLRMSTAVRVCHLGCKQYP